LSHILFVDDVLLFFFGSRWGGSHTHKLLYLYNFPMRMGVNDTKLTLFNSSMDDEINLDFEGNFLFHHLDLIEAIKYLGFNLKPNSYGKAYWWWLVSKIEKRVTL
jgi:hypothetical protein